MKARSISDTGRNRNDRTLNQSADYTCQGAFHTGDNDDDIGLLYIVQTMNQAMQAGHTDIIDALHLITHQLTG